MLRGEVWRSIRCLSAIIYKEFSKILNIKLARAADEGVIKNRKAEGKLRNIPKEGIVLASRTTRKGIVKADLLFENKNEAMNWARKSLGHATRRIYDPTGKWIGWENKVGEKVYWRHGDWGKGIGISTYPHLNYKIRTVEGHLFLEDKISNRGVWENFAEEFGL